VLVPAGSAVTAAVVVFIMMVSNYLFVKLIAEVQACKNMPQTNSKKNDLVGW